MREVTGREADVVRMFNPQSVAVIGASSKEGSLSWWPLHLLASKGFAGEILPINPTRDTLEGHRCYASIGDVGRPIDLAVVALNAEKTVEAVSECAAAGVKTVVLPSQGFGEAGPEGRKLQDQVAELARGSGMRIVGPNTDGIANLASGAIASIQPLFQQPVAPGPVGLVTQSGATASSLLLRLKQAGIGCRLYASAGNEIDLGLTDFMSVMVQDHDIRIILSFVESVRRTEEFLKVARLAAELGKPIVLMKVGRSEQGARRAAAHTGSLAGPDMLYDALFDAHAVIRVSELSEMVATAKLFLSHGAPASKGVGIISVSGGQAGAIADKASEMGVPVPNVSEETEGRLTSALKYGKGFNPCDLTGEVARDPTLATQVYAGFASGPEIGSIIYARKHLTANAGVEAARLLARACRAADATPLCIYAMDGEIWGEEGDIYRDCDIPVYDNLNDLFTAHLSLSRWALKRPECLQQGEMRRPGKRPRPDQIVGTDLLKEIGFSIVEERTCADRQSAVQAAKALGFPVVMKVASEKISHKTEAGGVALNISSPEEAGETFDRLMQSARTYLGGEEADGVVIQEQVNGAAEMILGIKNDPDLGPFVMVGTGGIFTELLKDVAIRPAPIDLKIALEMISELRGAALLNGFRGTPKKDVGALAEALVSLSYFAVDHEEWLAEADLNPILVLEDGQGVRVVDVLLVERD